jgi:hypothetical protein
MLTLDQLRDRYETMSLDALLDLWPRTGRTAPVESMLREVLITRGVPWHQLDELAATRPQRAPVRSVATWTRQPRHASTTWVPPKPATTPAQHWAAVAVFVVVMCGESMLAWQFLPAIDARAFHDFMLISMGLAFLPLVLALVAGAVVVALFALVAWLVAWLLLAVIRG